jgi:hypothetical protein
MLASDLSGQQFGRLIAVRRSGSTREGHAVWLWRCLCGREKRIPATAVKSGKVSSCGCLQQESRTRHGHSTEKSKTRTYVAWTNMKARCLRHPRYTSRSIFVCDRWLKFSAFLEDMGECPEGKTLERINNDGGYEPGNCKWATHAEQMRNTSRNIMIDVGGPRRLCLADACKMRKIVYAACLSLIRRGLAPQAAFERLSK